MSCVIPFPAAPPAPDEARRRPAARRVANRRPTRLPAPAPEPVALPGDRLPHFVSLPEAVADSRRRHRGLVTAAGQWALARGLSLPVDHVALWAAAAEECGRYGDVNGVTGPWLRPSFHGFVWSTLWNWCTLAGCRWPADVPESLWHLYGFLADSGRLHPDSDPVPELRKVLVCIGGLDLDGRPREGRSPIPCECSRDSTGPRHGALGPGGLTTSSPDPSAA